MYENGMMGTPMMGGYSYQGMAQPMQKFNNVLTAEQIKQLQQKGNQFSMSLTEEEILRGICNHRNIDGTGDALTIDPLTGEARCVICGYKFRPIEPNVSTDEIKEDVERIVDILQTIKLMYVDLPAEAANEYFPIIPLIEKIPQLFEFAAKNMTKHETYNWQYNNKNMGAVTMLNNLQNMFAGNMGFNPGMQQPQYQQPMMGAPMGYPPMSNGFGYPGAGAVPPVGNPAFNAGYAPQTAGFQYVPNQKPVQPVAPTAPEAPKTEATVTQNVSV
jgi:hypothetical protein